MGREVDGFADAHGICAHIDGERNLTNLFARVHIHHATAQDLAVGPIPMHSVQATLGDEPCVERRRPEMLSQLLAALQFARNHFRRA